MTIEESIEKSVQQAIAPLSKEVRDLNDKLNSMLTVMTITETAAYFKVTEQSIWNWVNRLSDDNPLPIRYAGGNPRFNLAEVDEWSIREAERKRKRKPLELVGAKMA